MGAYPFLSGWSEEGVAKFFRKPLLPERVSLTSSSLSMGERRGGGGGQRDVPAVGKK